MYLCFYIGNCVCVCVCESGSPKNQNYLLEDRPFVLQASPTR